MGQQVVGAAQHAAQRGADLDVVLAHRPLLVHRVERHAAVNVRLGDAQPVGHPGLGLAVDPALGALDFPQHRQHRRLGLRIPRHDRLDLLLEFGSEHLAA